MTIRRRLFFSFSVILFLFAANLVIYFWSNAQRSATITNFNTAITREIVVSAIKQDLNDLQKEISLMSQTAVDSGSTGFPPAQIASFKGRVDTLNGRIEHLRLLSDPSLRVRILPFQTKVSELGKSWLIFYQNFGVQNDKAVMELAIHADPTQAKVMKLLPLLQADETKEVEAATANFDAVTALTERMTLIIFGISTIIAIFVAFRVSRYLTRGLNKLKEGTASIGQGNLDQRIAIRSKDELGDVASAFNDMTGNLLSARALLTESNTQLERRNQEIDQQREKTESLLLNILPAQIAEELQLKGKVEPKYFEDVTILFADIVGFTLSTETLAAEDLVYLLHDYFTAFDNITKRYGLEKLKTIGDNYMCAGGIPVRSPSHPVNVVMAAFEMIKAVQDRAHPEALAQWSIRIGIHTGPVIAGVVGIDKFAFDVWGDTVNFASRIETNAAPNRINLSERTYSRVKDFFLCEHRGKIATKEMKEVDMYFANGILESLLTLSPVDREILSHGAQAEKFIPPAFQRRYRVYFQSDPPDFPRFFSHTVETDDEEPS